MKHSIIFVICKGDIWVKLALSG